MRLLSVVLLSCVSHVPAAIAAETGSPLMTQLAEKAHELKNSPNLHMRNRLRDLEAQRAFQKSLAELLKQHIDDETLQALQRTAPMSTADLAGERVSPLRSISNGLITHTTNGFITAGLAASGIAVGASAMSLLNSILFSGRFDGTLLAYAAPAVILGLSKLSRTRPYSPLETASMAGAQAVSAASLVDLGLQVATSNFDPAHALIAAPALWVLGPRNLWELWMNREHLSYYFKHPDAFVGTDKDSRWVMQAIQKSNAFWAAVRAEYARLYPNEPATNQMLDPVHELSEHMFRAIYSAKCVADLTT